MANLFSAIPTPTEKPQPPKERLLSVAPAPAPAAPVKWSEVITRPQFREASKEDRDAVRRSYFQDVVAPSIAPEEVGAVWSDYYAATQSHVDDTADSASMLDIVARNVENFLARARQFGAETATAALEETPAVRAEKIATEITEGSPFKALGTAADMAYNAAVRPFVQEEGKTDEQLAAEYRAKADTAQREIEANQPYIAGDSTAKQIFADAARSTVEMAPGMAASVVTRRPLPALGQAFSTSRSDAYAEQRDAGQSPAEAAAPAFYSGLAEVAFEGLPVGQIIAKPDALRGALKNVASKITGSALSEGATEVLTEAVQAGIERGSITPDMTIGEIVNRSLYAGTVGAATGGTFGTVGSAYDAATGALRRDSANPTPPPAPQVAPEAQPSEQALTPQPVLQPSSASPQVAQQPTIDMPPRTVADALNSSNLPPLDLPVYGDGTAPPGNYGDIVINPPPASPPPPSRFSASALTSVDLSKAEQAAERSYGAEIEAAMAGEKPVAAIVEEGKLAAQGYQKPESGAEVLYNPTTGDVKALGDLPISAAKTPISVDTAPEAAAVTTAIARQETAAPTPAQAAAGNYRKGKVKIHGLDVSLETVKGAERTGVDEDGQSWAATMPADYGYIRRTEGADGDHVDVYVGDMPQSSQVFIIDQRNLDGSFDEHKVMMGYPDQESAVAAYGQAFSDGRGAERVAGVKPVSIDEFKTWLAKGNTKAPASAQAIFDSKALALDSADIANMNAGQADRYLRNVRKSATDANRMDYLQAMEQIVARKRAESEVPLQTQPDTQPVVDNSVQVGRTRGGVRAQPTRPESLAEFISNGGGIIDTGGDLRSMGMQDWHRRAPFRRRLVRDSMPDQETMFGTGGQSTYSADDWALRAWESGYFPEFASRPSVQDLKDALERDAGGTRVYPLGQEPTAEMSDAEYSDQNMEWLDRRATELEIDTEGKDALEVLAEIADKEDQIATSQEADIIGDMVHELTYMQQSLLNDVGLDDIPFDPMPFTGEVPTLQFDEGEFNARFPEDVATQSPAPERTDAVPEEAAQSADDATDARAEAGDQDSGSTGEDVSQGAGQVVEKTEAGDQTVIAGAERISDKQLAERKMEEGMKAKKAQKDAGADGGLFDTGARQQVDMFDAPPKAATSAGQANIIQYPSGKWGFTGKVPDGLAYFASDSQYLKDAKQFGVTVVQKQAEREGGYFKSVSFDTEQAAKDALRAYEENGTLPKYEKPTTEQDFEHAGHKIYRTTVSGTDYWAVQQPDNRGISKTMGDTLYKDKQEAMADADRSAQEEARKAKLAAERESAAAEAQKTKDANKGKSIKERRADFVLDQPHRYGTEYIPKAGTKRSAMESAVAQGKAFEAAEVYDKSAEEADKRIVQTAKAKGYIAGLSNPNLPEMKAAAEATARLKDDKYTKPEYRMYKGSDTEGSFHKISKTEYDYAQSLTKQTAEQSSAVDSSNFKVPTTQKEWDTLRQSGKMKDLTEQELSAVYESLNANGIINKPVGAENKQEPIKLTKRGDFYEAYGDDAKRIAKALELVVTKRDGVESVGLPAHSLERNITALKEAGIEAEAPAQPITQKSKPKSLKTESSTPAPAEKIRAGYFEDKGYGRGTIPMNYAEQRLLLEKLGIEPGDNPKLYNDKLDAVNLRVLKKAKADIFAELSTGTVTPPAQTSPAPKATSSAGRFSALAEELKGRDYTIADHDSIRNDLLDGFLSAEQVKALFDHAVKAADSIKADIAKLTKAEIARRWTGRRLSRGGTETKDVAVKYAYDSILSDFHFSDTFQWSPMEETIVQAYKRLVDAQTDEMIQEGVQRRAAASKQWQERAQENAEALSGKKLETLDHFTTFIKANGYEKLSDEQLKLFDSLLGKRWEETRAREKQRSATVQGVTTAPEDLTTEIIETKHTQKGHDLFVVRLGERVEKDVYTSLNTAAKRLGGYYSSYRGMGATPGFQFTTRAAAESFVAASKGETVTAETGRKPETRADRIRAAGQKLIDDGTAKRDQDRKANTARRAAQAESAEADAARMIAEGKTMIRLAEMIEEGTAGMLEPINARTELDLLHGMMRTAMLKADRAIVDSGKKRQDGRAWEDSDARFIEYPYPWFYADNAPKMVDHLEKQPGFKMLAKHIEKLAAAAKKKGEPGFNVTDPDYVKKVGEAAEKFESTMGWYAEEGVKRFTRAQRLGYKTIGTIRQAVREYADILARPTGTDPIKKAERDLVGKKWDGYFPTPQVLADQMAAELNVNSTHTVLEPSAGKGSLVEAAIAAGADPKKIDVLEIVGDLRNLLEAKGFNLVGRDFLEHTDKYDRIIMNPPFEKGQDMEHVRHAYGLLNPNGKLVAIMSEGAFFRRDKKAEEFRAWLEEAGGWSEQLPEGSFKDSDRSTGVATRMVVIETPESSGGTRLRTEGESSAPVQQIAVKEIEGKWSEKQKQYSRAVKSIARKSFGDGLNLQYVDRITDGTTHKITGFYTTPAGSTVGQGLAVIAIGDGSKPIAAISHEGIHHLRRLGALDTVWGDLRRMAETKWIAQYSTEKNYPNDGTMSKDELRELHIEEAIAEAYSAYTSSKDGTRTPTRVEAVFKRIQEFFKALGEYLRGEGFTDWRSIFGDIESGKMKESASVAAADSVSDDKFQRQDVTQTPEFNEREDYQQRFIAAAEVRSRLNENGQRLKININGTITIYHGTSSISAEKIKKSGRMLEASYFALRKSDSEYYAKQKHKGGEVIALNVDARDIEITAGGAEIYAPTQLVRDEDGVWKDPSRYSWLSTPNDARILFQRSLEQNGKKNQKEQEARARKAGRKKVNALKSWAQRNLTKEGYLTEEAFELKIQKDGAQNAGEYDIARMVQDMEADVKSVYGKSYGQLTPAETAALRSYLAGEDVAVPDGIKPRLAHMREYLDRASARMQDAMAQMVEVRIAELSKSEKAAAEKYLDTNGDEGALPGTVLRLLQTMQTIESNKGTYLNRSYQAFDDPAWMGKVLENNGLMERAAAWISEQHPDLSDQEVIGEIRAILRRAESDGSFTSFLSSGSKVGQKDVSFLRRRKEVPKIIRELLGEYEDPKVNFVRSASKMHAWLGNQYFLYNLRQAGMGAFLFERPTGEFDSIIASEGSDTMSPIDGLYTSAEFLQGMKDVIGTPTKDLPATWQWLLALNSMVKYGKTILSPTTQFRNFYGGVIFAMLNGHWNFAHTAKALRAISADFRKNSPEWDDYLRELIELGVLHDNPYASELKGAIEDFIFVARIPGQKGMNGVLGFFQKIYEASDDFWKINGFENEKARIKRLHPDMSSEEVKKLAAKRIRNGYPTYSMVPLLMRKMRRFPITGMFVSFSWEAVRTYKNQFLIMGEDYRAAGLGGIVGRGLGFTLATIAPLVLRELTMLSMGIDDEDDEAVRELAAPWQKNSMFAYMGYDEQGRPVYLDLSSLDPYSHLKRVFTGLLNGNNIGLPAKVGDAMREAVAPFLGLELGASTVLEILFNKDYETGRPIYVPEDTAEGIATDIAHHMQKLLPGAYSTAKGMTEALSEQTLSRGKERTVPDEALSFVGFRRTTLNVPTALAYKALDFTSSERAISGILTRNLGRPGTLDKDDVRAAYERLLAGRKAVFSEVVKAISAAKKLNTDREDIIIALQAANVSGEDISALVDGGQIPEWRMSARFLETTRDLASVANSDAEKRAAINSEISRRAGLLARVIEEHKENNRGQSN